MRGDLWQLRPAMRLPLATLVAVLCCAATALAWDGVTPPPVSVNSSGIALGPPLGGAEIGGRSMWVDAKGRILALDVVAISGVPVLNWGSPRCWAPGAAGPDLGPLVADAPTLSSPGAWRIAARPGRDSVLGLQIAPAIANQAAPGTIAVYEAACGADAKLVATVAVPPGFPAATSIAAESLPLTEAGVVYVVLRDLVRFDSTQATSTLEVVATQADLRAALGLPATQPVEFRALALTSNERLWVAFETWPASDGGSKAGGLVELGKDGKLKVLHAADPMFSGFSQLLQLPALHAMVGAAPMVTVPPIGRYRAFAVLDEATPFAWSAKAPPWPIAAPLADDGLVGSYDGSVYARLAVASQASPTGFIVTGALQPLAVLPAFADFDRDGVSAAREAELGLSDLRYDSDGDGTNDGAELGLLGTDPVDPLSHPAQPLLAKGLQFGTSMLIGGNKTLPEYKDYAGYTAAPDGGEGSLQCGQSLDASTCPVAAKGATVGPLPCVDAQGQPVCLQQPASLPTFAPTADGKYVFTYAVTPAAESGTGQEVRVGIDRTDLHSGERIRFATGELDSYDGKILPLSETSVLLTRNFREVTRVTAKGVQSVVISGADGCPSSELLAPCPNADAPPPKSGTMRVVGYHAATKAWIFSFPRSITTSYIAVSASSVGFVADGFEVADGLEIETLRAIPGGGLLAKASGTSPGAIWNGTFVLPDLFGPGIAQLLPQAQLTGQVGRWFFHGFLGVHFETYFQEVLPDGCQPKVKCTFSFNKPIQPIPHAFQAEWVPFAPALEPGEIVFATETRYSMGAGAGSEILDSTADGHYGLDTGPIWLLGRITRLGAVVEWLDAKAFAALATDAAAQAALTATPLSTVTAIAAAPDASQLCIAEGGRVWLLGLAAGKPTDVTLADPGPGLVGCAFDAAGTLARLVGSPAAVRVGATTLSGDPATPARALVRVGQRWLIRGNGATISGTTTAPPAYCLADDGTRTATEFAMVALAEVPNGAMFVDTQGGAYVGRDPCQPATSAALERMGQNIWLEFYQGDREQSFSPRAELQVADAAIAMRPDRIVAMGVSALDVFGQRMLFQLHPTLQPLDPTQPMAENDAHRRATMRSGLLATWAVNVTAMATLRGLDPAADWAKFAPEPPFVWGQTGPNNEPTPADTPGPKAAADGGGCSAGPVRAAAADWLVALLFAAALLVLRRRGGVGASPLRH